MSEIISKLGKKLFEDKDKLLSLYQASPLSFWTGIGFTISLAFMSEFISSANFNEISSIWKAVFFSIVIIVLAFLLVLSMSKSNTRMETILTLENDLEKHSKGIVEGEVTTRQVEGKKLDLYNKRHSQDEVLENFAMDIFNKQKTYQFVSLFQDGQAVFTEVITIVNRIIYLSTKFDLTTQSNMVEIVEQEVQRLGLLFSQLRNMPKKFEETYGSFLDYRFDLNQDGKKGKLKDELQAIIKQFTASDMSVRDFVVPSPKSERREPSIRSEIKEMTENIGQEEEIINPFPSEMINIINGDDDLDKYIQDE